MTKKLYSVEEVSDMILQGYALALAGDEQALVQLPKGKWIAGTIPYFFTEHGGVYDPKHIYVERLDQHGIDFKVDTYRANELDQITQKGFENGFTVLVIPAFQKVHEEYALNSQSFPNLFLNPVIGWLAGFDTRQKVPTAAKVFNGQLKEQYEDMAVVMHVKLPSDKIARLEIINIFEQNQEGDEIQFLESGFSIQECLINGERKVLADYITQKEIDIKIPMIADYSGALINVGINNVDIHNKKVSFFAPVFSDCLYKFARPIKNYVTEFRQAIPKLSQPALLSYNCILNYQYGELEGKNIGFTGPATFGEIGYHLLNQTLVYLVVEENAKA